jgi:hypothetical protein
MKARTMTHPTTSHTNGRPGMETGVTDWVLDDTVGHIGARDSRGNPLMVIATGPLFAARLAAAFSSARSVRHPVQLCRASAPCFSSLSRRPL